MIAPVTKATTIIKISAGNSFVYRGAFFLRFIAVFISLTAQMFFWNSAFSGRTEIADYTLYGFLSYLILANVSYEISQPNNVMVSDQIQDGSLNYFLLIPYRFLDLIFWKLVGDRLAFIISIFLPTFACLFVFWQGNRLGVTVSAMGSVLFIFFMIGALMLHFLIDFGIGLLAFWFQRSAALFVLKEIVVRVLSGLWFPISLLPDAARITSEWLPFQFLGYVPSQAFHSPSLIGWEKFLLLIVWILFLYGVNFIIWRAGIKKYEAFGG